MQIIVTGHGNFASGIESTVKLLAGSIKNVKYVDFTEDMDEENLMEKFEEVIKLNEHIVFFCDLLGGTPYKQAAILSTKSKKDISVICGCNVGSLLENGLTGLDKFSDSTELAQALIESTKHEYGSLVLLIILRLLKNYLMVFKQHLKFRCLGKTKSICLYAFKIAYVLNRNTEAIFCLLVN